MSAPRILAVVPARGGSKGLPDKNIRELAGLPLLVHSLRAAALLPFVDRCIVTTDSPRIADVARAHGGDVPFLRPAELATDHTPMAPVLAHALAAVEEQEGAAYDAVLLLDPTSPARVPEQIARARDQLFGPDGPADLDGVVSVSEPTFNPTWVGVRSDSVDPSEPDHPGRLRRYFDQGVGITRRQDAARFLRVNGNFYLWRSGFIRRQPTSWLDEGVHAGLEIPEAQAFSIDDDYEFRLIEALLAAGLIRLPWLTRSGTDLPTHEDGQR